MEVSLFNFMVARNAARFFMPKKKATAQWFINNQVYCKVLNTLAQVSVLHKKLIESGIVEVCKFVNDMYFDRVGIVKVNLDTLKRISGLKLGRETIVRKNLMPKIQQNIEKLSEFGETANVLIGFKLLDNLVRTEEGMKELISLNVIPSIAVVVDNLDFNKEIVQIAQKLTTKLSNETDIEEKLKEIESIDRKEIQLRDFKRQLGVILLLSRTEDSSYYLRTKENFNRLLKIFAVFRQAPETKYFELNLVISKYFAILFADFVSSNRSDMTAEGLIEICLKLICHNWQNSKETLYISDSSKHIMIKEAFIESTVALISLIRSVFDSSSTVNLEEQLLIFSELFEIYGQDINYVTSFATLLSLINEMQFNDLAHSTVINMADKIAATVRHSPCDFVGSVCLQTLLNAFEKLNPNLKTSSLLFCLIVETSRDLVEEKPKMIKTKDLIIKFLLEHYNSDNISVCCTEKEINLLKLTLTAVFGGKYESSAVLKRADYEKKAIEVDDSISDNSSSAD